jgi:hypothetical protein
MIDISTSLIMASVQFRALGDRLDDKFCLISLMPSREGIHGRRWAHAAMLKWRGWPFRCKVESVKLPDTHPRANPCPRMDLSERSNEPSVQPVVYPLVEKQLLDGDSSHLLIGSEALDNFLYAVLQQCPHAFLLRNR